MEDQNELSTSVYFFAFVFLFGYNPGQKLMDKRQNLRENSIS